MKINVGYLLYKRAMLSPKLEALVVGDVRRSYRELNARANRLANAMLKMGVKRGDRVAVLALNEPEYVELYYGLGKIGVIMVPLNHRLAPPEVAYIANDCAAQTFIFGKEFAPVAEAIREQIPAKTFLGIMANPPQWAQSYEAVIGAAPADEPEHIGGDDDTLTILYTSGTTGRPKGAELTHFGYYSNSVNLKATLGDIGNRLLMPLPLFHIGALAPVPMCAHFGQTMIIQRAFEPAGFLRLIQTENISWFGSVPQVLMFLRSVPEFETFDWSTIKLALVYAAPVPVTLIKAFAEKGMEVRQLYGMTECTGPATVIDSEHALQKAGSCGPPFFHTDVRVVDDDGKDVGPDAVGELIMRTTHPMKGYLQQPRGHGQHHPQRLALLRRHRQDGRRRLSVHPGPQEGHDHLRRREHLPGRGRGLPARPSEHCRCRCDRHAQRAVGRGGQGHRGAQGGREPHSGGPGRLVQGQTGALQDAQGSGFSPRRFRARPPARCSNGCCGTSTTKENVEFRVTKVTKVVSALTRGLA